MSARLQKIAYGQSDASQELWDLGYRMTYAEIEIEQPHHTGLAQKFSWQDLDQAPDYPVLTTFLQSWQKENACELASIRVATVKEVTPEVLAHQGISLAIH